MKKLVLILFILLNGAWASAQKVDSIPNKAVKVKSVGGSMMSPSNSIMTSLSAAPDFSQLINVINTAALTDTFNGDTPVTLFAPTNKAFEKLTPGQLDTLMLPAHKAELTNLLMYHAVSGIITSKNIESQIKAGNGQATLTTLAGGILTAHINENRNIVLTDENGGQSVISRLDIAQSNSMLHVITAVLLPHSK
jgi:uncharacterized surface protein with fasciclin (FAS1) repeats